jgi:regulator of sigma E protease
MNVFVIIVSFIAILFMVASLHELGHFITARRTGVLVEEFGLGFPPRLFGIKKGETIYSLNIIPAGAFVKSVGENDPAIPRSLASRGPWQRFVIYAAGPLVNILLALILLSVFFTLPTEVLRGNGIMVYQVVKDFPADLAGIETGDILLSIDGENIHNSKEVQNAVNLCKDKDDCKLSLTLQKGDTTQVLDVTPHFNPVNELYTLGVFLCWNIVEVVENESPADISGVVVGDSLLSINSKPVYNMEDISQILSSTEGNEEIKLTLLREQEVVVITMPGVAEINQGTEYVGPESDQINLMGANIRWVSGIHIEQQSISIGKATYMAAAFIVKVPKMIAEAIPLIKEDPNKAALVGPIGAGQLTVEIVKSSGFDNILFIAGLISLGIGLFNLIPIPPLDGGGMLVAVIEGIRHGKRLTQRAMRLVYTSGTVLLITLMVLITFNDILRLIQGNGFGL